MLSSTLLIVTLAKKEGARDKTFFKILYIDDNLQIIYRNECFDNSRLGPNICIISSFEKSPQIVMYGRYFVMRRTLGI